MSNEDQELLARIGELAGQINRHKNRQAATQHSTPHAPTHRHNTYRQSSAPYPPRGRGGYRSQPHRHRTLTFNRSGEDQAGDSSASNSSGWVARNDRHRQIVNQNVFEKDKESRAKAIEETRRKKVDGKRSGERARFNNFYKHQQALTGAKHGHSNPTAAPNELTVEGIRFQVLDGGKKLARVPDTSNLAPTPKSTTIAGVKFFRTKTGNLVANRIVQDHRRSGKVKKTDTPCKIFSSSGSCPKGPLCRYTHDPNKVALCKELLREGRCANGDLCDLSHEMSPERVPNCVHHAKGNCTKAECPFTHSQATPNAPVCNAFGFFGYCDKGAECTERHVFECPDFSNTGRCKHKGCKLPHRERASLMRGQQKPDDEMDDVSSDDDDAGSDDIDSDAVAEFIDADSDASEIEDRQDFIRL